MNKMIKAVVPVLSPPESGKTISLEVIVIDDSPASGKTISLDLEDRVSPHPAGDRPT